MVHHFISYFAKLPASDLERQEITFQSRRKPVYLGESHTGTGREAKHSRDELVRYGCCHEALGKKYGARK